MRYIGDYDNPIFINLDMNMMNRVKYFLLRIEPIFIKLSDIKYEKRDIQSRLFS